MDERPGALHTARLDIVPATIALLEADLDSSDRLADCLRAHVPAGWPPGQHDREAVEFFLERARAGGGPGAGWYAWYIVLRGGQETADSLAGSIGFFGPPRDGVAEIGYSVVEAFRGRGIATEAIAAITGRALALPGVARVIAHTAEDNAPSQGALRRAGFSDAGPGEESGMRRFERAAPPQGARG